VLKIYAALLLLVEQNPDSLVQHSTSSAIWVQEPTKMVTYSSLVLQSSCHHILLLGLVSSETCPSWTCLSFSLLQECSQDLLYHHTSSRNPSPAHNLPVTLILCAIQFQHNLNLSTSLCSYTAIKVYIGTHTFVYSTHIWGTSLCIRMY
jgi:hypothetical protein